MSMRIGKSTLGAGSLVLLGLLAACQNNKELAGPPLLNGNWASSDGIYVAQLANGEFKAVANDTGNIISEGTYIALSSDRVQINWVGKISGRSNQAECIKPDDNQLDCVDVSGNKFSLRRTA